jgi:acyl-CoA thioester hydrolase
MTTDFIYRLRVRYSECDAQKVVFNARYGQYVDLAILEFLRTLDLAEQLIHGPLDFQLVKQTVEWKAPARFDQVLDIGVRTLTLGTTSFTLNCDFRIAGATALIATVQTIYVLVDAQTLTKTPLPADVRTNLGRGAPGMIVDHSDSTARAHTGRA